MIELDYQTQSPKMRDQLQRCEYRHEHWICSLKTITHSSCDYHPHNDFCILVTRVHENWVNSHDSRTPCSKSRYLPDPPSFTVAPDHASALFSAPPARHSIEVPEITNWHKDPDSRLEQADSNTTCSRCVTPVSSPSKSE
jgi:hypothetical protein